MNFCLKINNKQKVYQQFTIMISSYINYRQKAIQLMAMLEECDCLNIKNEQLFRLVFDDPAIINYRLSYCDNGEEGNQKENMNSIFRQKIYSKEVDEETISSLIGVYEAIFWKSPSLKITILHCYLLAHLICLNITINEISFAERAFERWKAAYQSLPINKIERAVFGDPVIMFEYCHNHGTMNELLHDYKEKLNKFCGSNDFRLNSNITQIWKEIVQKVIIVFAIKFPKITLNEVGELSNGYKSNNTKTIINNQEYFRSLPTKTLDVYSSIMNQKYVNGLQYLKTQDSKYQNQNITFHKKNMIKSIFEFNYDQYFKMTLKEQRQKIDFKDQFFHLSSIQDFLAQLSSKYQCWIINNTLGQKSKQKLNQKYYVRNMACIDQIRNFKLINDEEDSGKRILIINQSNLKDILKYQEVIENNYLVYCLGSHNIQHLSDVRQLEIQIFDKEQVLVKKILEREIEQKMIPNISFLNQTYNVNNSRFCLAKNVGPQNKNKSKRDLIRAYEAFLRHTLKQKPYQIYLDEEDIKKCIDKLQQANSRDSLYWIKLYTSEQYHFYRFINRCIRMLKSPAHNGYIRYGFSELYLAIEDLYYSPKNQQPKQNQQTFYRGTYLMPTQRQCLQISIGKFIQLQAFTSASVSKEIAMKFGDDFIEIRIKNRKPNQKMGGYAFIQPLSVLKDQKEVLFSPGNYFKVISVLPYSKDSPKYQNDKNRKHVVLELIFPEQFVNSNDAQSRQLITNWKYQKQVISSLKQQGDLEYFLGNFGESYNSFIENLALQVKNVGSFYLEKTHMVKYIPKSLTEAISKLCQLSNDEINYRISYIVNQNSIILCKIGDIEYQRGNYIETISYYNSFYGIFIEQNKQKIDKKLYEEYLNSPKLVLNSIIEKLKDLRKQFEQLTAKSENLESSIIISLMGYLYMKLDDYPDALQMINYCLLIEAEKFGEDHPEYGATWSILGYIQSKLGRIDEALYAFYKCRDIQGACVGSHHMNYALTLKKIGCLLAFQGNKKDALQNFNKCLTMQRNCHRKQFDSNYSYNQTKEIIKKIQGLKSTKNNKIFLDYLDEILFSYAKIGSYKDLNTLYNQQIKWMETMFWNNQSSKKKLQKILQQSYDYNLNIVALEIRGLLKISVDHNVSEKQIRKNLRNIHICMKNMRYLLRKPEKLAQMTTAENSVNQMRLIRDEICK